MAGTSVRIAANGEVELAGELIFDRYWNNEEATAEAIRDAGSPPETSARSTPTGT